MPAETWQEIWFGPGEFDYGTNVLTNTGFETDTTGWFSVLSATLARSTSAWYSGGACLDVNVNTVDWGGAGQGGFASGGHNAETWEGGAWVKAYSGTEVGNQVDVIIINEGSAEQFSKTYTLTSSFQWMTVVGKWTSAGSTLRFDVRAGGSTPRTRFFMDEPQMRRRLFAREFVHESHGNVILQAQLGEYAGDGANMTFRHDNNGGTPDYYSLEMSGSGAPSSGTFYKVTNGGADTTFGSTFNPTPAKGQIWRVAAIGSTFYAFKDGVQVHSATDADFASGVKFGFTGWSENTKWHNPRVWVQKPPGIRSVVFEPVTRRI